jgi:hypothetical protein
MRIFPADIAVDQVMTHGPFVGDCVPCELGLLLQPLDRSSKLHYVNSTLTYTVSQCNSNQIIIRKT